MLAQRSQSPEPSRRHVGAARLLFDVGYRLGLVGYLFLDSIELRERSLMLQLELPALRRIVTTDLVRSQCVQAALQSVGKDSAAFEGGAGGRDSAAPISFVFHAIGLAALGRGCARPTPLLPPERLAQARSWPGLEVTRCLLEAEVANS